MMASLRELGLSPRVVALCEATDAVVLAAQSLRSARQANSYTFMADLRRLCDAVAAWELALAVAQLDSDTNGFDRSQRWEGGDSCEQSSRNPQVHTERWACRPSSGGSQPQDKGESAPPAPAQPTGSAKQSRE